MNRNQFLVTLLLVLVIGGMAYYMGLLQGQLKDELLVEEQNEESNEQDKLIEELIEEDINDKEETLPAYEAGQVVTVNSYQAIKCSQFSDCPEGLSLKLDVHLTEDSSPDELTGEFFAKVYQNGTLVATHQFSRDWSPFAGDGGQPIPEPEEPIMTISGDLKKKFYLGDNFVDEYSEYFIYLKNDGEVSDYDGRWVDFGYDGSTIGIGFLQ